MNKKGMKFDDEKIDFTLIPIVGLKEEAKVLMVGVEKYERNNWQKVPNNLFRYIKSIARHINEIIEAMNDGIDPMDVKDEDDGLHPCAHIACDAHFILWVINKAGKLDDKTWKIKRKEIRSKYIKERNEHADKK